MGARSASWTRSTSTSSERAFFAATPFGPRQSQSGSANTRHWHLNPGIYETGASPYIAGRSLRWRKLSPKSQVAGLLSGRKTAPRQLFERPCHRASAALGRNRVAFLALQLTLGFLPINFWLPRRSSALLPQLVCALFDLLVCGCHKAPPVE